MVHYLPCALSLEPYAIDFVAPSYRYNSSNSINSIDSINSKSIITAFNPFDDAVLQSQVVHEAAGAVIVSPFLDNDQFLYAIGLSAVVIATVVLIVLINSIVARMMSEAVYPFLLPNFDVVRFAAFGQHPGFEIADGDQAHATPEACCQCVGKSKYGGN